MPQPSCRFPTFNLFDYFQGQTIAHGIFEDRFGKLRRAFVVKIQGQVQGQMLTLNERFTYNDGTEETRVWRILRMREGHYMGQADDILGSAKGYCHDNQLLWGYEMYLPVNGRKLKVRFDDQMYLLPDGVLINRAKVSKCGLTLGQVLLSFRQQNPKD